MRLCLMGSAMVALWGRYEYDLYTLEEAGHMIFQAIVTRYHGPTSTKAGRIKATAAAGSVTMEYDHSLNQERNHDVVAKALADKFKWGGGWYGGGMPDGKGNVYVCTAAGQECAFITHGEH